MGCGCGSKKKNGTVDVMAPAPLPAGIAYQLTSAEGAVELYWDLGEAKAARMPGDTLIAVRSNPEPSPV